MLHGFAAAGNTVLVIEHNLDVIKTADWLIDLGPEGGSGGGEVVCVGTPETVAACQRSYTGQALGPVLSRAQRRRTRRQGNVKEPRRNGRPTFGELQDADRARAPSSTTSRTSRVELPRERMTVCCGPSGSGKSSLALDTIYAEGQRRYIESLSAYARQFLGQMQKPKVEHVSGLSPAISIEQKTTSKSPRSTVGTVTEVYDYLRILYARLGQPYLSRTARIPVGTQTVGRDHRQDYGAAGGHEALSDGPAGAARPGEIRDAVRRSAPHRLRAAARRRQVVQRRRTADHRPSPQAHVEVVVDRVVVRANQRTRLADAVEAGPGSRPRRDARRPCRWTTNRNRTGASSASVSTSPATAAAAVSSR